MPELNLKQQIEQNLRQFATLPLVTAARQLFNTLGYQSEKAFDLAPNTPATFLTEFAHTQTLNQTHALFDQWRSVDFLFQLTDDEIRQAGTLPLFTSKARWENTQIESYLLFAIELTGDQYTRTQLAAITRTVNRLFPMPVLLLFKHGATLTLAVINRRLHKRDENKDVLEKVTLIKDIRFAAPHRAHIEILHDLALPQIIAHDPVANWVELHRAWMKTLDTKELNKRFYQELSHWYFWAMHEVTFPGAAMQADKQNLFQEEAKVREHTAKNLIRLLTRLLFVWFVKEKQLIPDELFDERYIREHLIDGFEPRKRSNFDHKTQGSRYYRAILQNLFFATLNQVVNKREFRKEGQHRNVTTLMRYERYFKNPQAFLQLMEATVPFMNGGLFECLDAPDPARKGPKGGDVILYEDGFSDRPDNVLCVPDYIFFGTGEQADLSEDLGDKKQKAVAVNGLINILKAYKFTIAENTPLEEDVALDPELLGQVFENLLASYNPETQTTARKQTGSFYTPREIVNYMVDESLKTYLKQKLTTQAELKPEEAETRLADLVSYNENAHSFTAQQTNLLINAIDTCKILDPACGSGAFPMGILHKLVHILHKLDPQNQRWKERQIDKALALDDAAIRDNLIEDIETAFANNELDYGRKLYLIENCIYGVDLQPIAIQISKLRFFISLIVDQKVDKRKENFGIRPLPNLETKFVAANTLINIEKPQVGDFAGSLFDNAEIKKLEDRLTEVRHRLFSAKTPHTKRNLREADQALREQMGAQLMANGWGNTSARQLAGWDPYNQNASADFFDPEWMFGVSAGFDVVIGNPPYVRQEQIKAYKPLFQKQYTCYTGTADLYVYFFERGIDLLREHGVLSYICSNKYFRAGYGEKLRGFLSSETALHQLIDFGDAPVFTAIAYPSIIVTSKTPSPANQVRTLTWTMGPPIEEFAEIFAKQSASMEQEKLESSGWQLVAPEVLRLLAKLREAGKTLGEYVNGRLYYGIKTGLNEAFVVDRATRDRLIAEHPSSEEVLKPYLRGRDIKRWQVEFDEQYLIKIESSENKKHPWSGKSEKEAELIFANSYPAIHSHFQRFRDGLIKRDDQGKYFWELRSCVYWQEFEKPKLMYQEIATYQAFGWDETGKYSNNKTFIIPDVSLSLLGLLNARLTWFFLGQTASKLQGNAYALQTPYILQLPLPLKTDNASRIEAFTKDILAAKRANPVANVSSLEAEIDRLVYQLYDLTAEEIAIIEG